MKTYSELVKLKTFDERYRYLRLGGRVGQQTFGDERYLNQLFYTTPEWKQFRRRIILRDNGCDLAMADRPLNERVYIHHLNPITAQDILNRAFLLLDPENVVCCCYNTHQAIHYGDESLLILEPVVRKPNDTSPWR